MVKTISSDFGWVDYKAERVGVRVRRGRCRPIILERGRWSEYGVPYEIPVAERELTASKTGFSTLGSHLLRVEESAAGDPRQAELRGLLTGKIPFDSIAAGA
ncbi:MAG TPA: hypothetical protein VHC90_18840 [Bryobacteraceae bacterium]|nr:hypothetical protein [Bryobacteraceae bacterium]